MKNLLSILLLCLVILSSCSNFYIHVQSASPTEKPTLSPTMVSIPTPTMTSTPVFSGTSPGWSTDQSTLWSGYSAPEAGVLGVRAQWIEPQVSGGPNSNMYIWIGVGGWAQTLNELVQIGTLAYTDVHGKTVHRVWYEAVPQLSQLTSMIVYPGDTIVVLMELEPGSNRNWNLSLKDMTRSTSFLMKMNYLSSQVYADFIVEDPHLDSTDLTAPLYPFQQFTSVNFTGAQVRYTNGWDSIGALRMLQITMVQHEQTVAYPSNIILPDSFSVIHTSS